MSWLDDAWDWGKENWGYANPVTAGMGVGTGGHGVYGTGVQMPGGPAASNGGKGKGGNVPAPPNFPGMDAAMTALGPNLQAAAGMDPTKARDQAIEANYAQATSRLDPQWQQRGQAFQSQMANQGLDPGTQAFDASQGNLDRARNDAYSSAMRGAIGEGNQAQVVQQMQAMLPFRQYGMLGGLMGDRYAAQMGGYGANQAAGQQGMQGMMDVAMLAAMFSDERMKMNITRLDIEVLPGVPVALWKWKDRDEYECGVIAQDLEKVAPEYVHTDPATGMKIVDYRFLDKVIDHV